MALNLFGRAQRDFSSLSEQEMLALAISSEEDDSRIYKAYAAHLRSEYPASAKIFDDMAEVENSHRRMLIDMFKRRFGDDIPLIRREHVRGFIVRQPDWLMKTLSLDKIRQQAVQMESQAQRFYRAAMAEVSDADTRKLLGDLALAEEAHEELAETLGEKYAPQDVREEEAAKEASPVHPDLGPAWPCRADGWFGFDAGADLRCGLCHTGHLADLSDRPVGCRRRRHFDGLYRSGPR